MASDIWRVLKYHEPVFIPITPKKLCYFLFILQGKEISHLVTLFSHAWVIGFTTTCDQTCDRKGHTCLNDFRFNCDKTVLEYL